MAGTIRGKVDCVAASISAATRHQEIFKTLYDHMERIKALGVVTRIALQYGDSGTGVDFHDGANPFTDGAFAVYRFAANGGRANDFYVLMQYGVGPSTNGAPHQMHGVAVPSSTAYVAFAFASALESDNTTNANPWAGTTVNNGTDTKATPVWAAPVGGTVATWPISNGTGGSNAANKEDTLSVEANNVDAIASRWYIVTDDDNFCIVDDAGDQYFSTMVWFGPFTPYTGLTGMYYALGMIKEVNAGPSIVGNVYDDASSNARAGGLWSPVEGQMRRNYLTSYSTALEAIAQPSEHAGEADFQEFPFFAVFQDAGLSKGFAGQYDTFLSMMFGRADQDVREDFTRMVVGTYSLSAVNWVIPYDGASMPRTGLTRVGTDFDRVP